jgi:hypothetical protein
MLNVDHYSLPRGHLPAPVPGRQLPGDQAKKSTPMCESLQKSKDEEMYAIFNTDWYSCRVLISQPNKYKVCMYSYMNNRSMSVHTYLCI